MSVRDLTILGCSSQQPTRMRNHGAYLVRWNDEGLLFDPGEGTQRQFIFAGIAPPVVTRIFISHFHGDHCLGLGSMLMRLNLDKVPHTIHCYYPASGKKYFQRLRYGTIYHEIINVVEHPVEEAGIVDSDTNFTIEAAFLDHGIDNIGWRITEKDCRKYNKERLLQANIQGPLMKELIEKGFLVLNEKTFKLEELSWIRKGDSLAIIIDTRRCQAALDLAKNARLALIESTYSEEHHDLAYRNHHLTAREAALIAKEAGVEQLVLTHFSARYQDLTPLLDEARAIFPNTDISKDFKVFKFPRESNKVIA
ncbi:MAG: ribonuclease Z [Chlamydiae bacterium]|nr:ribonuclease Z [Chlamydiota bacterium]